MKIVSRKSWGARPARKTAPPIEDIQGVVVHHTAGPQTTGNEAIRRIQGDHLNRKTPSGDPWWDIGYNYLIDRHGTVYAGRVYVASMVDKLHPWPARGSHCPGKNATHAGVCLLGNFEPDDEGELRDVPSSEQQEAFVELCATIQAWTGKDETLEIVGHRDERATDCPGQVFYDMLPEIRERVRNPSSTNKYHRLRLELDTATDALRRARTLLGALETT